MSIITIIQCNFCKKKLELGDGETLGAETILELNDANSVKLHFCGKQHLISFLATYTCPYRKSMATPARSKKIIEPFDE